MAPLGTVKAYDQPEAGVYRGQICKIDRVESEYNGEKKDQYKLVWKLTHYGDGEPLTDGTELPQWVNPTISPRSKFYKVIQGVLGREPQQGEEIDSDDLMHMPAMLTLVGYKRQDGSDGVKIESVTPYRRNRKAAAAPPPPPSDEDEEEAPTPVAAGSRRGAAI